MQIVGLRGDCQRCFGYGLFVRLFEVCCYFIGGEDLCFDSHRDCSGLNRCFDWLGLQIRSSIHLYFHLCEVEINFHHCELVIC